MDTLDKIRRDIAGQVRALRQERHWTQAELARHLGVSQNRLSEIERGSGSFTAEQFLAVLKLFNVPVNRFGFETRDRGAELQNALARLGAPHLQESTAVIPPEELTDASVALRISLLDASPRLLTALAVVLVRNLDRLNLRRVQADMVQAGAPGRLPWLIGSTLDAITNYLSTESVPPRWARRLRRAEVVLLPFLKAMDAVQPDPVVDVLDPNIRSPKTADEVAAAGSDIAKRWGIVTRLNRQDFLEALRAPANHE
jgi:transcriptional regulator with XRE-family HTH domain